MKRLKRKIHLLIFLVLTFTICSVFLLSVACNDERRDNEQSDNTPTGKVEMDIPEISLNVGESYRLTYKTNLTGEVSWRSSNDSVATVSDDGLVTAIGLGDSEIAVIIDEKAAICKVTVEENSSYEIEVNTTAITLDLNETFILVAKLTHMGKSLNIAPVFVALDTNIVTVAGGKITAVAHGNTAITVKFEYDGETFEKTVSVNVIKSGGIIFDNTSYDLDAIDQDGNLAVVTLYPNVVIGDQTIEDPKIEWLSSDETVIEVDSGIVRVKKAGQAFITAIYEDADGCTFENGVVFNIRLAQRQLKELDLDLTTKEISIDELTNIKIDRITINGLDVAFTQNGSGFLFTDFNKSGQFDVAFTNACYEFSGKLLAVSLIKCTDDFKAMLSAAKAASTQDGGFTGYYKLTQDLDFSGIAVASDFMQSNNQNAEKGWQATFDGNGYALKNVGMSWLNNNGIFGEIGTNGIIKNLSIIDPQYNNTGLFNGYGGIVAHNNFGRIENVYVELAFGRDGTSATTPNVGIVTNGRTGVIKGCLVVDKTASTYANTAAIVGVLQNNTDLSANAYISAAHGDVANVNGKTLTNAVQVELVQDLFKEDNATVKAELTMLKRNDKDIMWGNVKIFETVEETLISSEEEFVNMLAAAKTAATQDGGFKGYYKLTKDLDFTGISIAPNFMQTNYQVAGKGWQATFDGNGYALKNIGMSWQNNNGIFGEIGTNGIIKNLAIIITSAFNGYGGIVAHNNFGRIENVYVELAFARGGTAANTPNAGIVTNGRTGVVKGCLVVDKTETTYANTAVIVGVLQNNTDLSANAYLSAAHVDVANVNGKTLTSAVKIEAVEDLFNEDNATVKAKLTMLTLDGNDIMWGKVKIGTYTA